MTYTLSQMDGLDYQVATKVMGYWWALRKDAQPVARVLLPPEPSPGYSQCEPATGDERLVYYSLSGLPPYSTDIQRAVEVLCKARAKTKHGGFLIGDREEHAGGGYFCTIGLAEEARGEGESISKAICCAALALVEAQREST